MCLRDTTRIYEPTWKTCQKYATGCGQTRAGKGLEGSCTSLRAGFKESRSGFALACALLTQCQTGSMYEKRSDDERTGRGLESSCGSTPRARICTCNAH